MPLFVVRQLDVQGVVDYFVPAGNATFCEFITSHTYVSVGVQPVLSLHVDIFLVAIHLTWSLTPRVLLSIPPSLARSLCCRRSSHAASDRPEGPFIMPRYYNNHFGGTQSDFPNAVGYDGRR